MDVALAGGQREEPVPGGKRARFPALAVGYYQTDLLHTDLLNSVARAMIKARFEIMTYFISDLRIE